MKNKLVLSMLSEAGNFNDGLGVKHYSDRKHAGVFKDKLENGIVITEWRSGAKVYGVFKDGTMDGLGLFITRTKLKYYGQIKDFKPVSNKHWFNSNNKPVSLTLEESIEVFAREIDA